MLYFFILITGIWYIMISKHDTERLLVCSQAIGDFILLLILFLFDLFLIYINQRMPCFVISDSYFFTLMSSNSAS